MVQLATPGVYIDEVTGPSVIAGVGTSTAAFIGPALSGPIGLPTRITSFDDFIRMFGGVKDNRPWPYLYDQGKPYYMGFAVEGFYTNGGSQAFIVRVGTAVQASLPFLNQAGQQAFVVRALQDGVAANNTQAQTELYARQTAVRNSSAISSVSGSTYTVADSTGFRVGDIVTRGGNTRQIVSITGNDVTLSGSLTTAGANLVIANITPGQLSFRLGSVAGLNPQQFAVLNGVDAANVAVTQRVRINTVNTATGVVTLLAQTATYNMDSAATQQVTLTTVRDMARGDSVISVVNSATLTVALPASFRPGDIVTANGTDRRTITRIQGNDIILDGTLNGAVAAAVLRIANLNPAQSSIRLSDVTDVYPGTVLLLSGEDANNAGVTVTDYAVVESVSASGIVTLAAQPTRTNTFNLITGGTIFPIAIPQEFRLIIAPPPPATGTATPERFEDLSLNPFHPRYIFNTGVLGSQFVTVEAPALPPTTTAYPGQLAAIAGPTNLAGGLNDSPSGLTAADYQDGLDALRLVEDVNIVSIPDASSHPDRQTIQNAMITHCVQRFDRVAVLDSVQGAPPFGPNSVEDHRKLVQSPSGFAALYYPWLLVRDPTSRGPQPRTMLLPPSGHISGVYARTDNERGVHKAPANTDVRGVLGLERRLNDEQQGPLNLEGVDVLRIFPDSGTVIVWGGRTTVDPNITDWTYVNIRRLMIYIEQSIKVGIRWAVFEPNNLSTWKKLHRTINEFLTRVWRDGALFGEKPENAFYIRIDEALNPASTQALGRLYIQIGVRPSYPAEFIIVTIGLWDGGAEISE